MTARVALVVLGLVVLASVFAPLLAPYDPNLVIPGIARTAPSWAHPMGGDGAGRDVLSRLLFGGRLTLLGALVTAAVAMVIGIPAGLVAGYFGRAFDAVAGWVATMLMAIPGMVILLAATTILGPNTVAIMAVFGVLLSPSYFRLVRTAVLTVRNELYVDAARVSGLSDARILRRHILTAVRAPVIVQVAITSGIAVLTQTAIQFLGLGEQDVASWGQMLSDAFASLYSAPQLVTWPGLAIGLTVAALALLGTALAEERPARRSVRTADRVASTDKPTGQLLDVRGLTVSYPGAEVVRAVSFGVDRGEVLGLVGESGAGKTQAAFAVLGLLPSAASTTAGSIYFDGVDVLSLSRKHRARLLGRRIAYVPQEPMSNLDPALTVGHQLVEPLVLRGLSRADARKRSLELLDRVGIAKPSAVFAAYPHQISGGMAQRVLIAGAVSGDPELLIADEPTTALDVTVQAEVLDLLRELQQERRMAMVMVTHNLGVVADICDRVAVMRAGEIVEQRPVAELFAAPEHLYTRTLLDSTLEGAPVRGPLGSQP
jgi:peptide/nickel transport system permease protein